MINDVRIKKRGKFTQQISPFSQNSVTSHGPTKCSTRKRRSFPPNSFRASHHRNPQTTRYDTVQSHTRPKCTSVVNVGRSALLSYIQKPLHHRRTKCTELPQNGTICIWCGAMLRSVRVEHLLCAQRRWCILVVKIRSFVRVELVENYDRGLTSVDHK